MEKRIDDDAGSVTGIEHVELYVFNHVQAAHFYRTVFGFVPGGPVAISPAPDRASVVLERGDARLILTAPLSGANEVSEHLRVHGEGIADVAFLVRGVDALFRRATAAGATPLAAPRTVPLGAGQARVACLRSCGDLSHTLVERDDTAAAAASPREAEAGRDAAIDGIDHIAFALGDGELDRCVDFYVRALGFRETRTEQVSTEYSGMRTKVVETPNGAVRFPLLEPAAGRLTSQIESYVRAHQGPGAQHIAFRSCDIVRSVAAIRPWVELLATPDAYYDGLEARLGALPADADALRRHGILVDRDETGTLMQVFSKPIGTRPTLFLELIERRGSRGFGSGNIKALFEAVERLQTVGDASSERSLA
jgi:4-hydroxyphenylpyruvate dioxygenase